MRDDRAPSMDPRVFPPAGAGAMLNNLDEQVRQCYERAEVCAQRAAGNSDPRVKQDYLDLERRWLLLANSYEVSARLTDFSASAALRARDLAEPETEHPAKPCTTAAGAEAYESVTPFLRKKGFDPELVEAMGAAFANACEVLGLANRLDPITVMVAKKIIELAQRGFRDSGDIELMALKELKPDSI
jgi:hypothetical protein